MNIDPEIQVALAEIGPIEPWWSEDDEMFVFEHPAYPRVMHADPDKQEAVNGYVRALRTFIEYRMAGKVTDAVERSTRGRGGMRPGAGRPKGTVKNPTLLIRLPVDVATWLKADPANLDTVRRIIGDTNSGHK
jgi:hypothetical protein